MANVDRKSRDTFIPASRLLRHFVLFAIIVIFALTVKVESSIEEQEIMAETAFVTKIESGELPFTFPELIGLSGEEAKAKLREQYPSETLLSQIDVIPDGNMVTMDYREDRVRIFVDKTGKVTSAPHIG